MFVALLGATYWVYTRVPTGFVPDEDQGYIFILIQAPQGASLDYTMGIEKQVEQVLGKMPEIEHVFGVGGFGFRGRGRTRASCSACSRTSRSGPARSIRPRRSSASCSASSARSPARTVIPFLPPSVNGLGQFGGFQYELLDQSGGPIENLAAARALVGEANRTPGVTGVFTQFTANDPQLVVTIDREQAKSLGISLGDITETMQILLGSAYVNDFDFNNRSYRVYVQADRQFRSNPGDIERYYVREQRRPDDAAQQRRLGHAKRRRRRRSATTTCSGRSTSTDRPRPGSARARRFRRWSSCRTACCRRA